MNLTEAIFLIESAIRPDSVTHLQVRERAVELAVMSGRNALNVSKADWEQAKQELTDPSGTECTQPSIPLSPYESANQNPT